jgi:hypothetical protein
MNRSIFGKASGVIVDVCNAHGTWFDARELTASLAFIESGGLLRVEKRDALRKADEARAKEVERRTREIDVHAASDPRGEWRAESLRDLLLMLLSR